LTAFDVESAGRHRAWQQRLLDTYGPLLTDHQREACRLYLDEDWSVTELAEHLGCTRSGAHDLVRRGLAQLKHYELRLGHAVEFARLEAVEAELRSPLRPGLARVAPRGGAPKRFPRSGGEGSLRRQDPRPRVVS